MTSLSRIFRGLLWILPVFSLSAQSVPLYVAPAADHPPVARVSPSSPALEKANPVLEAARKAEGWFWAEYSGPFDGFIEARDLGAEDRPRVGAVVYAEPAPGAHVITTVEQGDRGALRERVAGTDFHRVALNKTIGVYFNQQQAAVRAATSARAEAREEADAARTERLAPARQTADTGRTVAREPAADPAPAPATVTRERRTQVREASPPPAPTPPPVEARPQPTPSETPTAEPERTTPRETAAETEPAAPAPSRTATPPREPTPRVTVYERPIEGPPAFLDNSTTLRGTFRQSGRRWLLLSPPQPYLLEDAKGNRLAWIDLSQAVLSQPIPELLDAEVVVYGEWKQQDGQTELVLECRNIRRAY